MVVWRMAVVLYILQVQAPLAWVVSQKQIKGQTLLTCRATM